MSAFITYDETDVNSLKVQYDDSRRVSFGGDTVVTVEIDLTLDEDGVDRLEVEVTGSQFLDGSSSIKDAITEVLDAASEANKLDVVTAAIRDWAQAWNYADAVLDEVYLSLDEDARGDWIEDQIEKSNG